jgi:hypothetical protein
LTEKRNSEQLIPRSSENFSISFDEGEELSESKRYQPPNEITENSSSHTNE